MEEKVPTCAFLVLKNKIYFFLMSNYPDYLHQTLARAREEGQWYAAQANAAALCFDMLAFFPDCVEARDLVYELFCDEWMIYDNRIAIQRQVNEWDDRPSEQRRRLALSFRFTSRWQGWDDFFETYDDMIVEKNAPADVAEILQEGKGELIEAYCLGDEECTNHAWMIFDDAIQQSSDPFATKSWVAKTYAELGFFADAVEVLSELLSQKDDPKMRRLLVELLWWRDNAHRIPWIPPRGDGSRYARIMKKINPETPTQEEMIESYREKRRDKEIIPYTPSISSEVEKLFSTALTEIVEPPANSPVDWSFLDRDKGEPNQIYPDWVEKQIKRTAYDSEIADLLRETYRYTRPIPKPKTPKRYAPNEPPFTPPVF